MTMPPCTKLALYRNGFHRLVWRNLTSLHKALTSTPSNNTLEMKRRPQAWPFHPTSMSDLTTAHTEVESWSKSGTPGFCSRRNLLTPMTLGLVSVHRALPSCGRRHSRFSAAAADLLSFVLFSHVFQDFCFYSATDATWNVWSTILLKHYSYQLG